MYAEMHQFYVYSELTPISWGAVLSHYVSHPPTMDRIINVNCHVYNYNDSTIEISESRT